MEREFNYVKNYFYKDGDPFRIVSGSMHYFRIVPDYWLERLQKLAMFGCNTVETFVPWNLHEPAQGEFNFDGLYNLESYIKKASSLGLYIILRVGPYIAAELDGGGLPSWVVHKCQRRIRCSDSTFLSLVENYFAELFKRIRPHLYSNGGQVIMLQIENEYGSYGNDPEYMNRLAKMAEEQLDEVLLATADQPQQWALRHGKAKHALSTVYFGAKAQERLKTLDLFQAERPKLCMEFWSGWYDHWSGNHHIRSAESTADSFEEILKSDASVNIYMFHGGTNFGFSAGASCSNTGDFRPTVTSYDCDALLSEAGEITEKYVECRKRLEKYVKLPPLEKLPIPERIEKKNITFPQRASLFDSLKHLATPFFSPTPLSMDAIYQHSGFILYRTTVNGPVEDAELTIDEIRDRAQIFINQKYHNTLYRGDGSTKVIIDIPDDGAQIDILVENMGRIDYGPLVGEEKGITNGVFLNNQLLFGWEIYSLNIDSIDMIPFEPDTSYQPASIPTFYQANFTIERPRDTFLLMKGWKKGNCFINGFNLGRYWHVGPQQTLYVPAPLLHKGKNSLVIFELDSPDELSIEFVSKPIYGKKSQIKKSLLSRLFART